MKTEEGRANVGLKAGASLCPHPSSLIPHPSGFTLIELLTVIAIITLVAALIIGIAGYATRKADRSRTMAQLQRYANALAEYRVNRGSLPMSSGWSGTLTNRFGAVTLWQIITNGLPSGYDVSEIAGQTDAWGNVYWYSRQGSYQFTLWSTGPSTLDASDDISTGTGEM